MKKLCVLLCCLFLILSGCAQEKYQRISFNNDILGENSATQIGRETIVINNATETFSEKLPIYQISKREIDQSEFKKMLQELGLAEKLVLQSNGFVLKDNEVSFNLASYTDFSRGYFDMTNEELERIAWETFEKLPFMDGEYEYLGIKNTITASDSTGDHVARVGVSFRRLLNDIRVVGEEKCVLFFDGSGLVGIQIALFSYKKIGTMDMVTLEEAENRIKTPDDFFLETPNPEDVSAAKSLEVDRVKLLLVNQYTQGCTILQPVYNFIGKATFDNDTQSEFSSKVIAIPESYTYESE